jgi:hypothetical protein
LGTDQSQTHLLAKPDGLVITKFNLSTKSRSKTNDRAAESFYIPRDVVLEEGDVNTTGSSPEYGDRECGDLQHIPEPPLGHSAVASEISKEFPEGLFKGAVVSFTEDEEDATDEGGIYHVVYADGDAEDLDHTEYIEAFLLNEAESAEAASKRQRHTPPIPHIRLEYKPGDTYSFRLTGDSFKGLEQVARELGWYEEGVRKGAKAKKKKVQRDDIFIHKETKGLCRVMKTTPEHKSFGDLNGAITARPFISYEGAMPHHALPSHGRADFKIMECDYLYVRPSAIVTVTGALGRAQGLRIYRTGSHHVCTARV